MSESYEAALEVNAALHSVEQSVDAGVDALRELRNVVLAGLIMWRGESTVEAALHQAVILRHRVWKVADLATKGGDV